MKKSKGSTLLFWKLRCGAETAANLISVTLKDMGRTGGRLCEICWSSKAYILLQLGVDLLIIRTKSTPLAAQLTSSCQFSLNHTIWSTMPSREDSRVGCSSRCMCMMRLQRHIGAVARMGPGSEAEWLWAPTELGCCWPESAETQSGKQFRKWSKTQTEKKQTSMLERWSKICSCGQSNQSLDQASYTDNHQIHAQ